MKNQLWGRLTMGQWRNNPEDSSTLLCAYCNKSFKISEMNEHVCQESPEQRVKIFLKVDTIKRIWKYRKISKTREAYDITINRIIDELETKQQGDNDEMGKIQ